jgi:hypothetical protein
MTKIDQGYMRLSRAIIEDALEHDEISFFRNPRSLFYVAAKLGQLDIATLRDYAEHSFGRCNNL